jgi:hypothetical protein
MRLRAFGLAAAKIAGIAHSVLTITRALAMQPRPLPCPAVGSHRSYITSFMFHL